MAGPPSRSSFPSPNSGDPSSRRLGVGSGGRDRPLRAQIVVALVAVCVLIAVPLYLLRRPGGRSGAVASASAALDAGKARYRDTDTTPRQISAIIEAARGRVLEVGSGNGAVAERIAAAGHELVAVDVTVNSARETRRRTRCSIAVAGLPELPFADGAFDTVVCAHTLEHIPDLYRAAAELRRVARRVIVVVPRQRYYRYTVDYHLHFFPSAGPLEHLLGGTARDVDGDWVVVSDDRV